MIIIPAKGTSRRAPGKNLRWLERVLYNLKYDDVLVSTDDPDIAYEAGRFSASFLNRPAHLTGPDATVEEVCRSILANKLRGYRVFGVVLPTAALVEVGDIYDARTLLKGRIDTVIAVARHERCHEVTGVSQYRVNNTDDYRQSAFADCGAFIWCKTAPFMKRQSFYDSKNIAVYVLPFGRGQDVDTPEDVRRVDALLR